MTTYWTLDIQFIIIMLYTYYYRATYSKRPNCLYRTSNRWPYLCFVQIMADIRLIMHFVTGHLVKKLGVFLLWKSNLYLSIYGWAFHRLWHWKGHLPSFWGVCWGKVWTCFLTLRSIWLMAGSCWGAQIAPEDLRGQMCRMLKCTLFVCWLSS